nr:MAG TPA: hypothetical protein [Caudoviricetes sp.]
MINGFLIKSSTFISTTLPSLISLIIPLFKSGII